MATNQGRKRGAPYDVNCPKRRQTSSAGSDDSSDEPSDDSSDDSSDGEEDITITIPPLIAYIQNILENYPDGSQILKEMIQNADDAGASSVAFLLDHSTYPCGQLVDPKFSVCQGQALYAWNNAKFTDSDWEGIRSIGTSGKVDDVNKVGRFGQGFVSTYHITDFPIILSDNKILFLDPHQHLNPGFNGKSFKLKPFFHKLDNFDNQKCFKSYFGYEGGSKFDETIFRFPLRNKNWESKIKTNGFYDTDRVMTTLFDPLMGEAETILVFLKNVKSIKLFIKKGASEVPKCIFSVEIPPNDKNEIGKLDLSDPINNLTDTVKIMIRLFPIIINHVKMVKKEGVWLVVNLIGFPHSPKDLWEFYRKNKIKSYIPWIGMAFETGIEMAELPKHDCWSYCYNWEEGDILSCINDILSNFKFNLIVPPSYFLSSNSGKLCCFLPTPENSHFPFHIHGYFALSNDRRRIKWPTPDSNDTDSKWNKVLIEQLGVYCYAIFHQIIVHRFHHENPDKYHYQFCVVDASNKQSLVSILVNQGLTELQDCKMIYSHSCSKWLDIRSGLYHPKMEGKSLPYEEFIGEVLETLEQPFVFLPNNVIEIFNALPELQSRTEKRIISPYLLQKMLKSNCDSERLVSKLNLNIQDSINLLKYITSDLNINVSPLCIPELLKNIPLLPLSSSTLTKFCTNQHKPIYIYKLNLNLIDLFPGLDDIFVDPNIPSDVFSFFLKLTKKYPNAINLKDISNIKMDTGLLVKLFKLSLTHLFSKCAGILLWDSQDPTYVSWIESIWSFLGTDQKLVKSLGALPLLPKEKIGSPDNQLLPIVTSKIYIQYSSNETYQSVEELLRESECIFVHKHGFIQCLDSLISPSLPDGLLTMLEQNNLVCEQFAGLLETKDNALLFQTIVNILNNKRNFTQTQSKIIKQLSIFPNMSENYIALSHGTVRVPGSFNWPSISFNYPNNFLSPLHSNVNALYKVLQIPFTNIDNFVTEYLINFMQTLKEKNKLSDHFTLSKCLLKNLGSLSQQSLSVLKNFEWIVDSKNNSVTSTNLTYRKPNELFNPEDQILSKILPQNSRFFPHCEYGQFSQYTRTVLLFNSTTSSINQYLFEEVIKTAVTLQSSITTSRPDSERQFFINLLKFTSEFIFRQTGALSLSSVVQDALCNNNLVLPCYQEPSTYPKCLPFLGKKSLVQIGSVVFCKQSEIPLVASVKICANELPECKPLLSSLDCQVGLSGKMLIEQLSLISKKNIESSDIGKVHQILRKIYASPLVLPENINAKFKFVYVKNENKFILPQLIVKGKFPFPLEPFYYSFDSLNYSDDAWKLFHEHGASAGLTNQMLYDMLLKLKQQNIDEEYGISNCIDLVCNIIKHLHTNNFHTNEYLLCQDNQLHLASECVFCDSGCTPNNSQIEKDGEVFYLLHDTIPISVAIQLGAKSFELTVLGDEDIFGFCDSVGQYEDLVTRLNNILQQYQSSIDVYKELVQNADDAKAKSVKILIDYSTFPSNSILTPSMNTWQGPAIYFYNDSQFTEEDFKNIMKIFGQTKRDDVFKIGKFGLGFNTVYHLTDLPSFVSGRYVHILDPQTSYIAKNCPKPGIRVDFTKNYGNLKNYKDQFCVFNLQLFNCNVFCGDQYNGTLFRLPFRTIASDISEEIYGKETIKKFASSIIAETEDIIRFLQHVTSIEIYERTSINTKAVRLLSLKKEVYSNLFPVDHSFLSHNTDHFESIFNSCKVNPISCHQKMTITEQNRKSTTTRNYIVSYASGAQQCQDFLKTTSKWTSSPFCSISFRTNPFATISDATEHKLYCFLPLPATSLYPMFINGYFELDHSRRGLCRSEDGSRETQWNTCLINDALVNALIELLEAIREYFPRWALTSGKMNIDNYYSIWPLEKENSVLWREFPKSAAIRIIQNNSPIFYSEFYHKDWLIYADCHYFIASAFSICKDLLSFVGEFSAKRGIYFVTLPKEFHVREVFSTIFANDSDKLFDIQRIFDELLFPFLDEIPLKYVELILRTVLPYHKEEWASDLLSQTKCIPCGIGQNVKFQFPNQVINPESRFAPLYKPNEMRTPHPSVAHLFKKESDFYQALKSLHVIHGTLPPEDVVDRLKTQVNLAGEERLSHCNILIKYLNVKKVSGMARIYDEVKGVDFIPVWEDELFSKMRVQEHKRYSCPTKCFSFISRYLITPEFYVIKEEIMDMKQFQDNFKIPSDVSENILIDLLHLFHENETIIKEQKLTTQITSRVLKIYNSLEKLPNLTDSVKKFLLEKNWIWHPDFNTFYKISEITESSRYEVFKSRFLPCFPFTRYEHFISLEFFYSLGLKKEIEIDCVMNVVNSMKNNYKNKALPPGDARLIIQLIQDFYHEESLLKLKFILSASDTLCPVGELIRDDIPWKKRKFSEKFNFAHPLIPTICLHNLKVPSSRSRLYRNVPFQILKFGQHEDISTRIDNFKRDCPNDSTILKEFLQNAEDASASEFCIIIDHQTYRSESLCFPNEDIPKLSEYQKCPSLLIYNNRAFTEEDLEGIQSVGLGGKRSKNTIGKFGLGFNAVYHLTESPCLLTRRKLSSGEFVYSYCIFDPYRKYLNIPQTDPPGIRLDLTEENFSEFPDQFKPFSLSAIISQEHICKNNLDLKGEFTIFRIPFLSNFLMPEQVKEITSEFLHQASEISLFLESVKNINFFEITSLGTAKRSGTLTCKSVQHVPSEAPIFSQTNLSNIHITLKSINIQIEKKLFCLAPTPSSLYFNQFVNVKNSSWLIYNFKGNLQELESAYPNLKKYRSRYENEKLSNLYVGIAIKIPDSEFKTYISPQKAFLYSYLPLGNFYSSHDYPVHINAPFIVDPHRQFLIFQKEKDSTEDQQWHDVWHVGILNHVIVPLYAKLLIDLKSGRSEHLRDLFSNWDVPRYFEWYYSLFPNMELLEKGQKQNSSFLFLLSKQLISWLYRSHPQMLVDETYSQWYSFSGENRGVFKNEKELDVSMPLYPVLTKLKYPLTVAPKHIALCLTKFDFEIQNVEQRHFLNYLNHNNSVLLKNQNFPTNFDNSILSFDEIVCLLHFLFAAGSETIKTYGNIPLKLDLSKNISFFSKSPCRTFNSEYAKLLPDYRSKFYDKDYPLTIISQLTDAGYIVDLPIQFLVDNLRSEQLSMEGIILFWRYVSITLSRNVPLIQKFGKHNLIPVKRLDSQSVVYLKIAQLPSILNLRREEISDIKLELLSNTLGKLGCPVLALEALVSEDLRVSLDMLHRCLDQYTIYKSLQYRDVLNALSLATPESLENVLSDQEANCLRDLLLQKEGSYNNQELKNFSLLKIFLTSTNKLVSVKECQKCYINFNLFPIGTISKIDFSDTCVISAHSKEDEIKLRELLSFRSVSIVSLKNLFLEYIIPQFRNLQIGEQQILLHCIEINYDACIIEELRSVPFITVGNNQYRVDELYNPNVELFEAFYSHFLIPQTWIESCSKILCQLGLHHEEDVDTIKECAIQVSSGNYGTKSDKTNLLPLIAFIKLLKSEIAPTSLIDQFTGIEFIPQWKYSSDFKKEYRLGYLPNANLHVNSACCSTVSWIHCKEIVGADFEKFDILKVRQAPDPSDVVEHLKILSTNFALAYKRLNNIVKLFNSSYAYLGDTDLPWSIIPPNTPCILHDEKLYMARNMVFETQDEMKPYFFKVPHTLADFHNFLRKIGVQDDPNHDHYAAVMGDLQADTSLTQLDIKNLGKKTFLLFINILRELESANQTIQLNLANILVFTQNFNIMPCSDVIFIDNTKLMIHLSQFPVLSNLELLHELPPNILGSCEPPKCLQITGLSSLIQESLAGKTRNGDFTSDSSGLIQKILRTDEFMNGLIRIYYHETKSNGKDNLKFIKIKDNTVYYDSDQTLDPSYKSVSQILNELKVVAVNSIDIEVTCLKDGTQLTRNGIYQCFKEHSIIYACETDDLMALFRDLTTIINSCLGDIFSQNLFYLHSCLTSDKITETLNSFNISQCPHLDNSTPAVATAPSSSTGMTRVKLFKKFHKSVTHTPSHAPTPMPTATTPTHSSPAKYASTPPSSSHSVVPSSSIGATAVTSHDTHTAQLWIRTAQCDLRAAQKLIHKCKDDPSVYASHACFHCFDCAIKACIAIICLHRFYQVNISAERNLDIIIEIVKQFFSRNEDRSQLADLCIPLMNYNEVARDPCMTPGIGCCIPIQCYPLEAAEEAIANASNILKLIQCSFPQIGKLMFKDEDKVWECPPIKSLLKTQLENFHIRSDIKFEILSEDCEEYYAVARRFLECLSNAEIVHIKKIHNKDCWTHFKQKVESKFQMTTGTPPLSEGSLLIKPLFHGSSDTNPHLISDSPLGFQIKFSRVGYWGKGIYFAVNAAYSHGYAHKVSEDEYCMFMAKVFVGNSKKLARNEGISSPPPGYHSVNGVTGNTKAYILYEDCLAYPSYLITYKL